MTPPTFTGPSGVVGIVPDASNLHTVGLFSPDRIADALAAYAAFGWSGETLEMATDRDGRLLIRPREHRADGWIAVAPVRVDDEGEAVQGEAPAPPPAPAAPAAVGTCEACGGPVTKAQKQMSALFLNRTLCRTCLDKIKEGKHDNR